MKILCQHGFPWFKQSVATGIVLCGIVSIAAGQARVLVHEDFERPRSRSLGSTLQEHPLLEIVESKGVEESRALKATYVGSERGSERIVMRFPLPRNGNEMSLTYDVKFDDDFQFVRGGKLLGLGPVNPVTGGNDTTPDGWSARINFRADGGIGTYIYDQDKDRKYGISEVSPDFFFEKGRYYALTLYLRINDRGHEANGTAEVYVDGERVVEHANLRFRNSTRRDSRITNFLFSTFHGGSNESWAPKDEEGGFATVHAYFDNIAIYDGKHVRQKPGPCW